MTLTAVAVFSVGELVDELGVSERDVIDIARDAGVTELRLDGYDIDYDDIERGVARCGRIDDLGEVELVIDQPDAAARWQWLTGMEI